MWYKESIFYQIYPFGFCGAPLSNDGITENRISKIKEWIPHIKKIGANALYLCPVFESDTHGYDTRDYQRIDSRLGSNDNFADVCRALHAENIKIVLDGVFNHVGRGFWAFKDVIINRHDSRYKDWFYLNFDRNSNYNDGFWYEGWEGHYNLIKLNLNNPEVSGYIFSCIKKWVDEFDIDGLRLDVAYLLDKDFQKSLRSFCKSIKEDFFLAGEIIHGDYNEIVNSQMLDSCTNYEIYKGIYSSFNDRNMFEIAYSLNRQFGNEGWTFYKGMHLLNFLDNHDVDRIASMLKEPDNLEAAFGLLFGIPGIPCIYYGSEWGIRGIKENGNDSGLRPYLQNACENQTAKWVSGLSRIRLESKALAYGSYRQLYLTNNQLVFSREYEREKIIVAVNAGDSNYSINIPGEYKRIIGAGEKDGNGNLVVYPHSAAYFEQRM